MSVLDIGCNCGFFDLFLSDKVNNIVGVEYNNSLIQIANIVKQYENIDNVEFICEDFNKFKCDKKFDIIFADPPYDLELTSYQKMIELILTNQWLDEGGNFVLEHPSTISFEEHPNFVQHKKYGNVHFSFFE